MFKRADSKIIFNLDQDTIQQKLSDGSIKRYVKGRLLGKGGFAKCYEVISLQTQKKYAAKIIEKASLQKSKAKQKLTSQIKIHKSLDHPNVVHFEHYFEDAEYVYILLEKCSNQTLNQLLKRRKKLTDIQTKYYIRQLAVAIKYIHDEHIIHRDLKLGNLFLSEKLQIKIGDFGLATKLNYIGERRKTKCGTPNYIAPQILNDKKSHSYQVDVWSMGVITYALLVGKPPFQTNDVKDTYSKIRQGTYDYKGSACSVSDNAKSFIDNMLQVDPSKRATLDQILQHPFLLQSSIPPLLPISSLACPPSLDFLKKFRDMQNQQSYPIILIQKQKQKQELKPSIGTLSVQKNQNKFNTRINSVQKMPKAANRVLSAANLLSHEGKNHIRPKKNDLASKSLKIFITIFDQNPKYGLGYILNTNAAGFRYNDTSSMISTHNQTRFRYIQHEFDSLTRKHKQINSIVYKPGQADQKQHIKLKILLHFHRQLNKIKQEKQRQYTTQMKAKQQAVKSKQTPENTMKCFIRRYHRTNKSTIFWLSTDAMQVIFQDGSHILINKNQVGTFINKNKQISYFEYGNKQTHTPQIKKRLTHFHTILQKSLLNHECRQNVIQSKPPIDNPKPQKQKNQTMSRCNSTKLTNISNIKMNNKTLKTSSSNNNLNLADKTNRNYK